MLLAFESIARTASACLVDQDGREVAYADLAGGEAERGLVPLIDGLIRRHGRPSAFAVAAGPGSFTGLRIGVVAARTLAWMEQVPVHPVDSLAARAAEAGEGLWWVLIPLKRDTTFLELNARAALEYLLQRGDKVVGFVNSKSSDRLGRTTTALPVAIFRRRPLSCRVDERWQRQGL
jgi:tRNA threonylcarbamoyl adenosine modification protein YeaZ